LYFYVTNLASWLQDFNKLTYLLKHHYFLNFWTYEMGELWRVRSLGILPATQVNSAWPSFSIVGRRNEY